MIDLILLAVAGVLYWAWKTRDPQAMRISDVMAIIAALVGLKLLKGHSPLAILALGGAGWWFWFRRKAGATSDEMTAEEARQLLELPRNASADDVRTAHRRLVARVHPDAGGSAALTRQVNLARDVLLQKRH